MRHQNFLAASSLTLPPPYLAIRHSQYSSDTTVGPRSHHRIDVLWAHCELQAAQWRENLDVSAAVLLHCHAWRGSYLQLFFFFFSFSGLPNNHSPVVWVCVRSIRRTEQAGSFLLIRGCSTIKCSAEAANMCAKATIEWKTANKCICFVILYSPFLMIQRALKPNWIFFFLPPPESQ